MYSAKDKQKAPRYILLGLACALVLLGTGCGDGRVRVSGNVVFEGKPLEEGFIALLPSDGVGPTTGGPIKDGKYDLNGEARSTTGEKIVRIVGSRKTGRKIPAGSPPGAMTDEYVQCIPSQYNDQSTLRVQITPGKDNSHNFDLKPPTAKQ
jgi:hypothetical protein